MKKLQLIAVAFVAVLATLTVAPSAQALDPGYTCENEYTGSDSENLCISKTSYDCELINENDITIFVNNDQEGISGNATYDQNTGTGSATTGSASNNNESTFNFTITNGDDEEQVCVAKEVKPAKPVTPETSKPEAPVTPAAPVTPQVTAPKAGKPAVLAPTSGNKIVDYTVGAIASLAAAVVVSRLAVMAYGRLKS